jgi:hypothetical protein
MTAVPLTADSPHRERIRSHRRSLAPPTIVAFIALAFVGAAKGLGAYAHRSHIAKPHVSGTNAVVVHVCIAVVFFVIIVFVEVRRRRGGRPAPWSAPFLADGWSRMRVTFTRGGRALARLIVVIPMLAVMLYGPFRMGAQIFGGLDPNATVNAWGGPTYIGAMAAHWLDCVVGFYAAAAVLHVTLRRLR